MEKQQTPDQEREETLAYLERERELWLGLRGRVDRTGGRDAQLSRAYEQSNDRMNHLLEDLFAQNVMLEAFENVQIPTGAGSES